MTTPRVRIVHLSVTALDALAAGDLVAATAETDCELTTYLVSSDAIGVWRRRAAQVRQTPADLLWVTGVVVDESTWKVVGAAGFHAAPDADGMVEVGYRIDPAHRRRGYARATLLHLLDRARAHPEVHTLRATVSPDNTASLSLIAELPFTQVGEQWDDEDGLELVWEIPV